MSSVHGYKDRDHVDRLRDEAAERYERPTLDQRGMVAASLGATHHPDTYARRPLAGASTPNVTRPRDAHPEAARPTEA